MALASYVDSNTWLDGTKISFANDDDAAPESIAADRIVTSALRVVYPDNVDLWTAPTNTPGLVTDIAAMLMASFRYAKIYSEEALNESDYSARLEARAMTLIKGLQDGTLQLEGIVSGTEAQE